MTREGNHLRAAAADDLDRRMPLGLFKGERTFTLASRNNGDVEFSMREEYTGLLAPLIGRSIPDLQPAFDQFASDLKRAAGGS